MTDVIHFSPRAELDCDANLEGFITICRTELTVFGADLPFDENTWDVTDALDLKAKGNGKTRLVFSTWGTVNDVKPAVMSEPFLSFAKAYVRYQHALRPTKGAPSARLAALRALESAMTENGGPARPALVTAQTLDRAVQLIKEKFTSGAYQAGCQLQVLGDFLAKHRLMILPVQWRHGIARRRDTVRVGEEFDRERRSKLPSQTALRALTGIFRQASEPRDVLVSSIAAILCSAPDRINEVLHLEADCEVSQPIPSSGEMAYGLRWRPSKGADPMIKWIVPSMADVVRQALNNVRRITNDARTVAQWYERHPGQIYLPAHLEHLRTRQHLSCDDIADVLFAEPVPSAAAQQWCKRQGVPVHQKSGTSKVALADLERAVVAMLPRGFPIANGERGLRYSNALCLLLRNSLNPTKATFRCVIQPVGQGDIATGLGARSQFGFKSIFDRFGLVEDDGSPIHIRSHQFRHYLNTLAQMGGLSQLDIALWSGRKDIRQNSVYDHESDRDILARVHDAIGDEMQMLLPAARGQQRALVRRADFQLSVGATGHTTQFGYCMHDFTMLPCQLHRDCINCNEQVCVKGDAAREASIRRHRDETRALLSEAMAAQADGFAGADRWVEHQQLTLARLDQLCAILDDPDVPNGTFIKPPGVVPASRLEQAAARRKLHNASGNSTPQAASAALLPASGGEEAK